MRREKVDVLIVGGGAAGLAAAISATKQGVKTVLLERDRNTGGVLNQCIHNGFGLHVYKEELTGPEFMERMWEELEEDVIRPNFTVLKIDPNSKEVVTLSEDGIVVFEVKTLIMATGARERPLSSLRIPGVRVSGVYTAGVAQRMVNIYNRLPGKRVLIVGSGDIGLIMARRLKIEGMDVVGVVEIMPEPGGLIRNVVQCLEDFDIPLLLSHTVIDLHGDERLKAVTISKVDENWNPIPGTEKKIEVDTLVTSVGLIPQNELIEDFVEMDPINRGPVVDEFMRTSVDWIFAAGNNIAIHDLVDFVYDEGKIAGYYASLVARGKKFPESNNRFLRGKNIGVLLPQKFSGEHSFKIYIRPKRSFNRSVLKFNDKIIRKFNWRIRPSEMIDFVVKNLDKKDITVEVNEID
ncbi:pyridine nucleotide-disulfide oxidoreductase [Thermosipho melanesiensis]|uniref:FAD-dependent pyridine nucleotide-disulphide oxidoreductase n=2 Tax=Thermosipho melanesiensis TaxID=46541 RepID=A6LKN2_THEM4|nr:NAD(P)/FAD-dependent oxidoreductase [Thermosipho melanesiensis]ABR30483.1 FAD-dependent pyridine nucleotide-disulphide oxidoreductase [Thermosipho melanesiensis BI429]APT73636.1 pyridine nucleotide-disulfide oxidoreductase [Thermosipho melanesiensis]OOC35578.1 pyridine nucleotide-disulfide oxidoreductase [Thermosipho melanesiensis]OOC39252.1 pyridine nucleotide-disulfide oxidoreductase [Thermosipho melanesiensis]OOC39338.1 pyridine nucleotide-disulfide oxidoreductase [Thermosipho melanesien